MTHSACLLLLAAALAAAESAPAFPGKAWEQAAPGAEGVSPDNLAQAVAHLEKVCGSDGSRRVVIVRNGRVLWAGPAADERILVWSCTKSFLGLCLGLLWDDGRCSPETRAASIMPELQAGYPAVTLAQLATFTSGYGHVDKRPLEPAAPRSAPGAALEYNSQPDLLAAVLTRLAGEPLHDLFMRRIGSVIGLDDGSFQWGVQAGGGAIPVNGGSGYPESGVHITANAMARVGWLCCRRGNWDGRQLVSERYFARATAVQAPESLPPFDPKAWYACLPGRYGYNWWVNGMRDGKLLWPSVPASTFAAQGNKNSICIIVPERKLVLVRLGADQIIDVALYDGALRLLAP